MGIDLTVTIVPVSQISGLAGALIRSHCVCARGCVLSAGVSSTQTRTFIAVCGENHEKISDKQ